jgi:hypothetical protein
MSRRRIAAVLVVLVVTFASACSSHSTFSTDSSMNYKWVFATMPGPMPEIVNSHVERVHRCCFLEPVNGDWAFEFYTSQSWLDALRTGFKEIQWSDVWPRNVPSWFKPRPAEFDVWQMQQTSYPNAHFFVERAPREKSRIHVFVRRF